MKHALYATLCFGLLLLVGCGGPASSSVDGTVTVAGKPATGAIINFLNATTGDIGSAELDGSGGFKISEGLPPGTYKVFVVPKTNAAKPPMPGEAAAPAQESAIPQKYRSEATDLTYEIKPGKNTGLTFNLE
jgi:hypothetical protein